MVCMCGDKECDFKESESIQTNFIFTPRPGIRQREVMHVLSSGVRCINIDMSLTTKEELQKLVDKVDWAIRIFLNETKFNLRISKVCTIRGRQPRTGRMRNNNEFNMKKCDNIVLTSDKRYEKCSNNEVCFVSNFEAAVEQLKAGDFIQIGSTITLKIAKVALKSLVTCYVVEEGCLKSHQLVKLPVAENESHEPIEEELEDCLFAMKNEFDIVIVPLVKRPEYYHTIKRVLKGSRIQLLAQVATLEKPAIDKIIEHFYGVFVNESTVGAPDTYIVDKARELRKLIIAEFSIEKSTIDAADSFMLSPSKCAKSVIKSIEAFCKAGSADQSSEEEIVQEASSAPVKRFEHAMVVTKSPDSKLIISLSSMRFTVEEIASGRPACPIILLTTCPAVAKICQFWKNVHAMVYVDYENKPWSEQRDEMTQIAALYGSETNMLEAKDFCVTWFDSVTIIDNKQ